VLAAGRPDKSWALVESPFDNLVPDFVLMSLVTLAAFGRLAIPFGKILQIAQSGPSGTAQGGVRCRSGAGRWLGAPKAITAAAHKLARILFHLIHTRQPYDESVFAAQEIQNNQRIQQRLHLQAKKYGYQIVEITAPGECGPWDDFGVEVAVPETLTA